MRAYIEERKNEILAISPFADLNYERAYSATSLILMFFLFSFTGWIWEVLIHIIEDGMIINRGLLLGPWLPIYGTGGVLILMLLKRWRSQPLMTMGLIMLLCGTVEYITSIGLEFFFGQRWWDYSDMLFNFQGRICLEGLLIFGIGGLFFIYLIAPKIDNLLQTVSQKAKMYLCVALSFLFVADLIRSFLSPNIGFGITG